MYCPTARRIEKAKMRTSLDLTSTPQQEVNTNESYAAIMDSHVYAEITEPLPRGVEDSMSTTQNSAYEVTPTILTATNECYATNVPVDPNPAYGNNKLKTDDHDYI